MSKHGGLRPHKPVQMAALILCFAALVTLNVATSNTRVSPLIAPLVPGAAAPHQEDDTVEPEAAAAPAQDPSWMALAARAVDRTSLAAEGVAVPPGANVFVARIVAGGPSPAYMMYEAGGGGFSKTFYPASSIKLLAAVGALELAYASGFTGEAIVDGTYSVAEYYDAAIRQSSNEDYDALVRIAGVDWLNEEFLPSHSYRSTRIQDAYAEGGSVAHSPPAQLVENGRELLLPFRDSRDDYGCEAANCSTLVELVDSLRRVVMDVELAPEERFAIAPADVAGLQDALQGADSWIGPGVAEALGTDADVYSKPGWTSGHDCVDVALVTDGGAGHRYLIGVSAPDDGECAVLAAMAADVLSVVAHRDDGEALRTDGTLVPVVDGRPAP